MACTNRPVAVVVSNANSPSVGVPAMVDLSGINDCATLQFNLSGLPNYSFPTASPYGISITEADGTQHPVSSEFTNFSRVSATEVTVDDANTGGEDYSYQVTLTTPDGGTLTSDPIIRNRN